MNEFHAFYPSMPACPPLPSVPHPGPTTTTTAVHASWNHTVSRSEAERDLGQCAHLFLSFLQNVSIIPRSNMPLATWFLLLNSFCTFLLLFLNKTYKCVLPQPNMSFSFSSSLIFHIRRVFQNPNEHFAMCKLKYSFFHFQILISYFFSETV